MLGNWVLEIEKKTTPLFERPGVLVLTLSS